jgi:hypothetical protein
MSGMSSQNGNIACRCVQLRPFEAQYVALRLRLGAELGHGDGQGMG